ncbi:hypothetical protein CKF54_04105 [Psittacicella hinzii]|uniref:Uncharacterized protein n=1 Tax=Psittacicella hinzii TaxID=2028575 RepID=A0A3A1Y3R2_9GAMM|nr:hypothetical protein [Psittacicella hinzii]RIY32883.1 hypothetical protein CKF54_04105 [Psittacicella hinzii]
MTQSVSTIQQDLEKLYTHIYEIKTSLQAVVERTNSSTDLTSSTSSINSTKSSNSTLTAKEQNELETLIEESLNEFNQLLLLSKVNNKHNSDLIDTLVRSHLAEKKELALATKNVDELKETIKQLNAEIYDLKMRTEELSRDYVKQMLVEQTPQTSSADKEKITLLEKQLAYEQAKVKDLMQKIIFLTSKHNGLAVSTEKAESIEKDKQVATADVAKVEEDTAADTSSHTTETTKPRVEQQLSEQNTETASQKDDSVINSAQQSSTQSEEEKTQSAVESANDESNQRVGKILLLIIFAIFLFGIIYS